MAAFRQLRSGGRNMVFLVEMDLIKSGEISDPKDGINFIEQIIQPTLEVCVKWKEENRIVAGGPVNGSSKLVFVMKVESATELDLRLMTLPLWAMAQTTVTSLLEFEDRIVHVRRKAERLKALLHWPGHARPTDPL